MRSRGYITIFLSLMLAAILIVAIAVIEISDRRSARVKASTALSSAMSSEMACYNRLIFDRYHILLLDKNASGGGEGAMEASMEENLKTNLGDSFTVNSVELSGYTGLMDDDLQEFKDQISENFKYSMIEYSIEKIMEKTDGNDEPISDKQIKDIDDDVEAEKKRIAGKSGDSSGSSTSGESSSESNSTEGGSKDKKDDVTDPRETLKTFLNLGLEGLLLPEDAYLSDHVVDVSELPSLGLGQSKVEKIKTSFTSLTRMKKDAKLGNGWGKSALTYVEAVAYGGTYFNCLTDKVYDDTYLNLEMEYIIGGETTDAANYRKVVDEIMLIRFGMNLAYIITDTAKMAECDSVALALTVEFPPAEPVVKYLIAGCWAYIESIADVYLLLRGHSVPFMKTFDTWTTNLESLSDLDSLTGEPSDLEKGLSYKEYLLILMALQGDKMYYRMLDLMQLNVTKTSLEGSDSTFRMSNAITAFGVNADVGYRGEEIELHEEIGY